MTSRETFPATKCYEKSNWTKLYLKLWEACTANLGKYYIYIYSVVSTAVTHPATNCDLAIPSSAPSAGEIPKEWLLANICPLFKKGNRALACNYRHVSLTCVPCKLLEHIDFKL